MITMLTTASKEYRKLVDLTTPSKLSYSNRWGYKVLIEEHKDMSRWQWERPELWLKSLRWHEGHCSWLFFTGADAGITNPSHSLEELFHLSKPEAGHFIFSVDNNGLQSDSFLLKNCPETHDFLESVIAMEGKCNNEQDAMQIVLSQSTDYGDLRRRYDDAGEDRVAFFKRELNRTPLKCRIVPREILNARPNDQYGGTGKEPFSWTPFSLVCHCPGKSLQWRLENMAKYLAK